MWDMQGHTMITNNYIRLTPDRQSRQGAIWNKVVGTEISTELRAEPDTLCADWQYK